jgi:ankyrin repeat protein
VVLGIEGSSSIHLCCGLSVQNAPAWHVSFAAHQCAGCAGEGGLLMEDVRVVAAEAVAQHANGVAGVSISTTTGTLAHLRNVTIVTEDDNIEVSAPRQGPPTRNVLVEGCQFGTGHGASMHTNVRDVVYNDNTFNGTSNGFRIKTHLGFSEFIANITYRRTVMHKVGMPLMINGFYFSNASNATTGPAITDVTVDGLQATLMPPFASNSDEVIAACLFCSKGTPCRGVTLRDVHVSTRTAGGPSRGPVPRFACHHAFGSAVNTTPPASACLDGGTEPLLLKVWQRCTGYPRVRVLTDDRPDDFVEWVDPAKVLVAAVTRQDADGIKRSIEAGADAAAETTGYGAGANTWTALRYASAMGYSSVARQLVDAGVEVDAPCPESGTTALLWAASKGHDTTLQFLLSAGADPNHINANHRNALQHATQFGHTNCVRSLIKAGANVNYQSATENWTALIDAAEDDRAAIAKLLIAAGAHVDHREHKGMSALLMAAQVDSRKVATVLLRNGAKQDLRNHDGWTPLMVSAQKGHLRMARLLKQYGADSGLRSPAGMSVDAMLGENWADDIQAKKHTKKHQRGRRGKTQTADRSM